MANERELEINQRFYQALQRLISDKVIRGKKTFTDRYGINRWNLVSLEQEGAESKRRVPALWLSYLVEDYGISAQWLLTGQGKLYATAPPRKG